jgi:hypothetical protein
MSSIITIQFNKKINSRTYKHFETRKTCIEYILQLFEEYDRGVKSKEVQVLNCNDLFCFLFSFHDFAYFEKDGPIYKPFGKDCFCQLVLDYVKNELEGDK